MRRRRSLLLSIATLLLLPACAEEPPGEWIVGTWVIDAAAQRAEIEEVSPDEVDGFDDAFRATLAPIRETFHPDGRYVVQSSLGGPFEDRWEIVSRGDDRLTIRSSGHSWVARAARISEGMKQRADATLTYERIDADHMSVSVGMSIFGEEKQLRYFFVRAD